MRQVTSCWPSDSVRLSRQLSRLPSSLVHALFVNRTHWLVLYCVWMPYVTSVLDKLMLVCSFIPSRICHWYSRQYPDALMQCCWVLAPIFTLLARTAKKGDAMARWRMRRGSKLRGPEMGGWWSKVWRSTLTCKIEFRNIKQRPALFLVLVFMNSSHTKICITLYYCRYSSIVTLSNKQPWPNKQRVVKITIIDFVEPQQT